MTNTTKTDPFDFMPDTLHPELFRKNQKQPDATTLDLIINHLDSGVALFTPANGDYPVTYCNQRLSSIIGSDTEEMSGKDFFSLIITDSQWHELNVIEKSIINKTHCHEILKLNRQDGSEYWCELTVRPITKSNTALHQFIAIFKDVTEFQQIKQTRRYAALYDPLTSLPNRQLLERAIDNFLSQSRHSSCEHLLLHIDIDHFKPVNDSIGHRSGDQLLQEVASRLARTSDAPHMVGRQGGDEFIIFFGGHPNLDEDDISHYCHKILQCFDHPFFLDNHQKIYLTCSIGVDKGLSPSCTAEQLMHHADIAMSSAKQSGRNTWALYRQDMEEAQHRSTRLRSDLRSALHSNEFYLEYQPQIDLMSGKVVGLEALIRWQHPEKGLISPADFIGIAEESGIIIDIGHWVLRSACNFNQSLIQNRITDIPVAVNISLNQFVRNTFIDEVYSVLEDTGLPHNRLALEITESTMMGNIDDTVRKIRMLSNSGISIAVDDFGTGFSNLSYLKRFPLNKLKIDKSFIDNVTTNSSDAGIVLAIISMAHHLDLTVIAEGVETEAQKNFLRRNHCEQIQGFYYSKPMPQIELIQFLTNQSITCNTKHDDILQNEQTILLVDDEPNILRALSRTLRKESYRVLTANSAQEGFDIMAREQIQVIISDQRMPDMSGIEFLSQIKSMYPDAVRIILSGYTELSTLTNAINHGAIYRFLTKPWDEETLKQNIDQAFRYYERIRQPEEQSQ